MKPAVSVTATERVGSLSAKDIGRRLRRSGLRVYIGPFIVSISSNIPDFAVQLRHVYADYQLAHDEPVCDIHARIELPATHRRWLRPTVVFAFDDQTPFDPMPRALALPMLEWGINWAIAMRSHQYLMLHAAVVARADRALIMPAQPGNGKTTLCAALVNRGWRLLSDEFGLVDPNGGNVVPIPRLMPLKNESIDVIRAFAPSARLGPVFPKTKKGTVSHMLPPSESLDARVQLATPAWVLFPKWRPSQPLQISPSSKGITFFALASNAFNYEVMGATGFETVAQLVDSCSHHTLAYSDLDEAMHAIDELTSTAAT